MKTQNKLQSNNLKIEINRKKNKLLKTLKKNDNLQQLKNRKKSKLEKQSKKS